MKKGFFFDDSEIRKHPTKKRRVVGAGCRACGLHKKCLSPKMEPHGDGELNIVVVAEAPGATEDEQGIPLVGKAGKFLRQRMREVGLNLDRDCIKLNVVQCRPTKRTGKRTENRPPTAEELQCCWPRVEKQIKAIQPDLIYAFGTPAIASILRDCPTGATATNMHGRVVPSAYWGCWVACGFHPSYFIRGNEKHAGRMDEMLSAGYTKLERGSYYEDDTLDPLGYVIIEDLDSALDWLNVAGQPFDPVDFDYETNGLDPWDPSFKILLVSFAKSPDMGWVIPLEHPQSRWTKEELAQIFEALKLWLQSGVDKIVQNREFEEIVSRIHLGVGINNVICDTMVRQHVIDNRQGVTSQGFQEYVRYGSLHKGQVNKAKLEHEFLDTVAKYGALDARYGFRIFEDQNKEMDPELERAYDLFHEAIPLFVDMKERGIQVDEDILFKLDEQTKALRARAKKIHSSPWLKKYKKRYGKDWDKGSPQAKQRLFYGIMGLEPTKLTAGGESFDVPEDCSTDAESMKNLLAQVDADSEEAVLIQMCLDNSSLTKLGGYIKNIKQLSRHDGFLHPSFCLHNVSSYRSSSNSPNFQNFPIRKPQLAVLRTCLVPRYDHLVEVDFKGNEVCGIGAASLDENLIIDIRDKVDFHRHFAARLYGIEEEEVTKEERYYGKNEFVFPEFYGSYYGSIAKHRPEWEEKRVQLVEKELWDRYGDVKIWQEDNQEFYERHGYVQYLTGFKCRFSRIGLMSFNNVCNSPIQGIAFHRLLKVLIELDKAMKKEKFESLLIGQIHDSIVADVIEDELDDFMDLAEEIAGTPQWDWDAVIPWTVEIKIGPNLLELSEV